MRPPAIWTKLGLVPAGTLWTLRRAVYGLRVAPRAWGLERDFQLREVRLREETSDGQPRRRLCLRQCSADSQVWLVTPVGSPNEMVGLLVV